LISSANVSASKGSNNRNQLAGQRQSRWTMTECMNGTTLLRSFIHSCRQATAMQATNSHVSKHAYLLLLLPAPVAGLELSQDCLALLAL
jgi:hypothetical protein